MPPIQIDSEVGSLESVIVHTPGQELLAVTPGTREDYLYDDIIDIEIAQREHRRFVAVLERFATVHQVGGLLAEALEQPEAREFLITKARDVVPSSLLAERLRALPAAELVRLLIEGVAEESGPIASVLNETGYAFPPLPNLFFPRDVGFVLGPYAVVGAMRYDVRWTEELLIKALFRFHPALANEGLLYDGTEERRSNYTLEGGDVHRIREDLLVVGFSERTSASALDLLCDVVFERDLATDVIVVVMPTSPVAIHLDMIFSMVDRELCVVYPPYFVGPERLPVLHRRKGTAAVREMPGFFSALKTVGMPVEPILCGGGHRISQEREQWASACNFLALRPGVAVSYRRNDATHAELANAGFRVISAVDLLAGQATVPEGERTVIMVEGSELVRGGGGPRCMTLPLRRGAA